MDDEFEQMFAGMAPEFDEKEFWRLPTVMAKVGLSRSEIYRRIDLGLFPRPRHYPGTRKSFWVSGEVRSWQDDALQAA